MIYRLVLSSYYMKQTTIIWIIWVLTNYLKRKNNCNSKAKETDYQDKYMYWWCKKNKHEYSNVWGDLSLFTTICN